MASLSLPRQGKCNRGLMVIGSLKYLVSDRELTDEEERRALILGWCIEWVSRSGYTTQDAGGNSVVSGTQTLRKSEGGSGR